MKKIKLFIGAVFLLIGSFTLFTYIDIGWKFDDFFKLINPFLFSISLTLMVFLPGLRKLFLYISIFLMIAMVILYLLNLLDLATWVGSLGFGLLVIMIGCFSPELIKKGCIENF